METPVTGTRQLGMGAAGTATTEDHTVPWWNSAALGWETGAEGGAHPAWGQLSPDAIGLDVTAGFHAYGEILQHADQLLDAAARVKELGAAGVADKADLQSLLKVAKWISELDNPADSVLATGNVAAGVRMGRFAVGLRVAGEAAAYAANIDLLNVIPDVNLDVLANQINANVPAGDTNLDSLSASQADAIYTALGGTGGSYGSLAPGVDANATAAVQAIDDAMKELGVAGPLGAEVARLLTATASGTGTLDQNTTSVVIQGFILTEIPISIGFPVSDYASFGASVKLMNGRVNGTRILVFQDDVEEAMVDLKGEFKDTFNLGVDLGFQAKAGNWRIGVNATNLNSPIFKAPASAAGAVTDYRIDPQVTIGLGWRPVDWFTIAADIEQFEVGTINPLVMSRRAGAGFEFAAIPWIDLRGGVYGNIADSEAPPVVTAGAGLGPEWFRIDAAVACASELQDFGEWQLPTELRASIGVSSRF